MRPRAGIRVQKRHEYGYLHSSSANSSTENTAKCLGSSARTTCSAILAFPIEIYGSADQTGPEWGGHQFTGLIVYEVTVEDGFAELGRISSMDGTPDTGCYWSYWGFTRGVFIGDTVYSVTQNGVKSAVKNWWKSDWMAIPTWLIFKRLLKLSKMMTRKTPYMRW